MSIKSSSSFSFVFFVLMLLHSITTAQSSNYIINTKAISTKDGLASRMVNCGMQDSRGFVWLGTSHGLQRYDGRNFKLFTKEKNGLQDNNVLYVAEDQNQCLWILYGLAGSGRYTDGRCDIFDLNTNKIKPVNEKFGGKLPFDYHYIREIIPNQKNELVLVVSEMNVYSDMWIYTKSGGFRKLGEKYYSSIFRDSVLLVYTTNNVILKINTSGDVISKQMPEPPWNMIVIMGIHPDGSCTWLKKAEYKSGGKQILGYEICKSDAKENRVPLDQFTDNKFGDYKDMITAKFYDPKSGFDILMNEQKGIVLFDGSNYVTLVNKEDRKKFSFQSINDYFTTSDGKHWLCTEDGLLVFQLHKNHFTHLLSNDVFKMPLVSSYQCRSIYADTTGVYIKSWDGLYRSKKNGAGVYQTEKILEASESNLSDGFYCDGADIWFTGNGKGVVKYNLLSGKKYFSETKPLIGLWNGITLSSGKIIVGHTSAFAVLENNDLLPIDYCDGRKMEWNWTYKFINNSDNKLWAITNKGIYEISQNLCVDAHYTVESKDSKYKIPFTDIHDLYEAKSGICWLATNGGGLIKWNRKNNSSQQFTIEDGLSSNVLYAVLEDEKGFLWLSSENGLMRFDTSSNFVKTYTTNDGLSNDEFNRISYFKALDGTMFFGGLNGVNAFHPEDFWNDTTAFSASLQVIAFNQFNTDSGKLIDRTIELQQRNSITMQPGDKFFNIEFQLLNFEDEKHRFAYMIEGIDKTWNYISENSIRISGLPYGKFTLHIKAQSTNGTWSKQELSIPLLVIIPFYKETWFLLMCTLLMIGSVWMLLRWRTYSLNKRNVQLESKVKERTTQLEKSLNEKQSLLNDKDVLLKEIHHRVKNNLQVISGLLELQSKNVASADSRNALIEGRNRVSSMALIHQNLYQNNDLGNIELGKFVKDLHKQVEKVFQKKNLHVQLQTEMPELNIDIDTIVPLGLILNELLTNSFKYAFNETINGDIEIMVIQLSKGTFELNYRDSGCGLPDDYDIKKSRSLGMQLINDLSRQIGGRINYSKLNNCFTILFLDREMRKMED